jgi:FAD-dependent urate hydroxylase
MDHARICAERSVVPLAALWAGLKKRHKKMMGVRGMELRKRALIIGAGIGGPVAAVALKRAGFEPVVFERQRGAIELRGSFLGLGANGLRVLRELELLDAVLSADTIPIETVEVSSTTGRFLGRIPNGSLDRETSTVLIMRGTLHRILADAAKQLGVSIEYGKEYVGHRRVGGGIVASFTDGSEARGALLIGADGIHSAVRRVTFPAERAPRFTGKLNITGVADVPTFPATQGNMRIVWGRCALFGYAAREGQVWWSADLRHPRQRCDAPLDGWTTEDWRRRLRAAFADDPPFIRQLINATPHMVTTEVRDLTGLRAWHHDRVVLMGDAAHAVVPSTSQGAALAIEDAIVLAKCLRDAADLQSAFRRYEELRRARAERMVARGRRQKLTPLASDVAIRIRDRLAPLVFRYVGNQKRTSWIYDYEAPWNTPVFEH